MGKHPKRQRKLPQVSAKQPIPARDVAEKTIDIIRNVGSIERSLGKDRIVLMVVWPTVAAAAIPTGLWGFLGVNILFAGLWYLFKKQRMMSE